MAAESYETSNVPKYLQKIELTQENKDLIATLPSDSFWKPIIVHKYNGFWHTTKQLQGTTFSILNRKIHYPNSDLDKNNCHPHPLLTANPHDLVPFLEMNLYCHKAIPDLSSFSSPRPFASHMPYICLPESVKLSRCKIVYLCRNPKDMFVSMWHFIKKLAPQDQGAGSIEDLFEKFCEGRIGKGPFWDHILGNYKKSLEMPNKVMFLTYEELKSEPNKVLKDLAEFLGHGFTKEEENGNVINDILKLCSFENLSNLEVNKTGTLLTGEDSSVYFRRGEVGDGENFLTPHMIRKLDVITQEKLGKYGVNFQTNKS